MLQDLGKHLVHIHGQNTHLAAASKTFQRRCLDQTGGLLARVEALNTRFASWHATEQAKRQHQAALLGQGDLELLRHYLTELADLAPTEDDWQHINQQLNQAQHGAKIAQSCQDLVQGLSHASTGVVTQLERMLQQLAKMPEGMLGRADVEACLHEALVLCQEAEQQVATFQQSEDLSSEQKRRLETRLGRYFELARKHQVKPSALHTVCTPQAQYDAHDAASFALARLEKQQQAEAHAWFEDAKQLTAQRAVAAEKLAPKLKKPCNLWGWHMHACIF